MEKGRASDRAETAGSHQSGSTRPQAGSESGWLATRSRAQTTIDFTVGVVLFVFVLVAIFTFVSGTIQPFTSGDQDDIVTVNRVADGLSKDTLGDPNEPYVLDRACTVAFFEGGAPPADCRFSDRPLEAQVGVTGSTFLNVTIRGNVSGGASPNELLCWDQTAETLVEQGGAGCGGADVVPLAVGADADSGAQSSVTARRSVAINGTNVSLVVKLW